jgi:hypothetical protein
VPAIRRGVSGQCMQLTGDGANCGQNECDAIDQLIPAVASVMYAVGPALDDLIAGFASSGLQVVVETDGELAALPAAVQLSACAVECREWSLPMSRV